MGSPQQMREEQLLVEKINEIYTNISNLTSLKPSKEVDMLFSELVSTCIPPSSIDVSKLTSDHQTMRSDLIKLCGTAEGFLEAHYSTLLGAFGNPLDHVTLFPYYSNYLKLSLLEHTILTNHSPHSSHAPRVAFLGSGPLPLTSIVLAKYHMKSSVFHNYDIDPAANAMAQHLVSADEDLSSRMVFHTADVMELTSELKEYDVVFLAALVGMDKEFKLKVIEHLERHMAPGAVLMLRSAAGARAFLYPVVQPEDLRGRFEVMSVFHPKGEVINSVVIARKGPVSVPQMAVEQPAGIGSMSVLPCKVCSAMLNPLSHHGSCVMEELVLKEQV